MLVWNPAASSSRRSFSVGQLGVTAAFALAHGKSCLACKSVAIHLADAPAHLAGRP